MQERGEKKKEGLEEGERKGERGIQGKRHKGET
jgi:hypothetical protein